MNKPQSKNDLRMDVVLAVCKTLLRWVDSVNELNSATSDIPGIEAIADRRWQMLVDDVRRLVALTEEENV